MYEFSKLIVFTASLWVHFAILYIVYIIFVFISVVSGDGHKWYHDYGTQNSITIYGVITESGEYTTNLSLYGVESGGNTWVVVTLDFDPIFSRNCRDNDYYEWLPWDDVRKYSVELRPIVYKIHGVFS